MLFNTKVLLQVCINRIWHKLRLICCGNVVYALLAEKMKHKNQSTVQKTGLANYSSFPGWSGKGYISPMDVITMGHTTTIFLFLGHFGHGDTKPTKGRAYCNPALDQ